MNIPFCKIISMPIVYPTLKIDVFKMEQTWKEEEELMDNHIHKWDIDFIRNM
jgi:hypothetical protein